MGPLLVTNGVTCGPQKNHETFLDTQVTVSISGSNRLGVDADWSDGKTLYIKVHPKNAVAVASLKDAGKWEVIASGCFFLFGRGWAGQREPLLRLWMSKRLDLEVWKIEDFKTGILGSTLLKRNKSQKFKVTFDVCLNLGNGQYSCGPRWWFQIFFIFTPKIGEDEPILTIIFFKLGWFNHQPGTLFFCLRGMGFFEAQAILAGAVSDWNKENPTKAVQPGDRVHGDPGMKMDSKREIQPTKKRGPVVVFRIDRYIYI